MGSGDARVLLPATLGLGATESAMVLCSVYICNKRPNRSKKDFLDEEVSFFKLACPSGWEKVTKFLEGDAKSGETGCTEGMIEKKRPTTVSIGNIPLEVSIA